MHLFYTLLRLIVIGSLSFSQFEREGFEGFGRKKGEREREKEVHFPSKIPNVLNPKSKIYGVLKKRYVHLIL